MSSQSSPRSLLLICKKKNQTKKNKQKNCDWQCAAQFSGDGPVFSQENVTARNSPRVSPCRRDLLAVSEGSRAQWRLEARRCGDSEPASACRYPGRVSGGQTENMLRWWQLHPGWVNSTSPSLLPWVDELSFNGYIFIYVRVFFFFLRNSRVDAYCGTWWQCV